MDHKGREEIPYINETIIREHRRRQKRSLISLVVSAILFGCVSGCCFLLILRLPAAEAEKTQTEEPTVREEETESAERETQERERTDSILDGYEAVKDSFVRIRTVYGSGDWLIAEPSVDSVAETFGVVVAVDEDWYYILTSADTIDSAETIYVSIGTDEIEAEEAFRDQVENISLLVVGTDELPDGTALPVIDMGSTEELKAGDTVIVAGSPYSHFGSVNYGHLVYRYQQETYDGSLLLLCTDMPADPLGDGVLLNQEGELIGWMLKRTGSQEVHMITAAAMDDINGIIDRMIAGEPFAFLGIGGEQISAEAAEEFEIPKGMYLTMVADDSPAKASGIQPGDIVLSLDGTAVENSSQLWQYLQSCEIGDNVTVQLMRMVQDTYEPMEIEVMLGER